MFWFSLHDSSNIYVFLSCQPLWVYSQISSSLICVMHPRLCLIYWRNTRLSVRIRYTRSRLAYDSSLLTRLFATFIEYETTHSERNHFCISLSLRSCKLWPTTVGRYVAETGSPVSLRPPEILQDGQYHLVTAARDGDMETHNIPLQVQHTHIHMQKQ